MKDNLTQIVFILDRSGSMDSLAADTIGGYNGFIEAQKAEEGEALLTTVLFDNEYEILHDSVNLKDVKPLTEKDYYARGMTALLDAVGKTIKTVGANLAKMEEEDRPSKVIVVITTDGFENASKEFTQEQVKTMIEHQRDKYNWEFIFLGANIDSVGTAKDYGITYAADWTANSVGAQSVYTSLSRGISNYRGDKGITADWSSDIK
jgi:uncharacterized protein YegL